MARPFTASDEDILNAARKVMSLRGPDAFSIAAVAHEVGLSRAAIILRFKSTHALKVASLRGMVEQFASIVETLPATPSGDNLLRVAAFIGTYMRSRESSVRFFANFYSTNVLDRELLELEAERGVALDRAITRVMPNTALDRESAVIAFRAHLTGSITSWLTSDDSDSRRYLVLRTVEWLKLARIEFTEYMVQELSAAPQSAAPVTRANPRVSKNRGGAKSVRTRAKSRVAR